MKFEVECARDLFEIVKQCKYTCADKKAGTSRPDLRMIEMNVEGSTLTITALDGFVAAQKKIKVYGAEDGVCVIDPMLIMRATDCDSDAKFSLDSEKSMLRCITQTGIFHLQTFTEREFANHEKLWEKEGNTFNVSVNIQNLDKIVRALKGGESSFVMMCFNPKNTAAPIILRKEDDRAILCPVKVYNPS